MIVEDASAAARRLSQIAMPKPLVDGTLSNAVAGLSGSSALKSLSAAALSSQVALSAFAGL